MKHKINLLAVIFLCLACLTLGSALTIFWVNSRSQIPETPQIAVSSSETQTVNEDYEEQDPTISTNSVPEDKISISDARKAYDGGLTLNIPKLNVDKPVLNGTSLKVLRKGLGLYDYSAMPSEENGNVCIAGHRNGIFAGKITDNTPFYYINTLTEGDYIYLIDDQTVYQYLWKSTSVILPNDWSVIYNQGYSCITLTTCTPIGVADHRLVVRGELVNTFNKTDDMLLKSNRNS